MCVFWVPHKLGWEDSMWTSGECHWLRVRAVAESAGQTPGHRQLPAIKIPGGRDSHQFGQEFMAPPLTNHSFAPIKQSSPRRMPRKSITTKLPIWFDSVTTCRQNHNVWLSFSIISLCRSAITTGCSKPVIFRWIRLETNFNPGISYMIHGWPLIQTEVLEVSITQNKLCK